MNPFAWQINGFDVIAYAKLGFGVVDIGENDQAVVLTQHPDTRKFVTAIVTSESLKTGTWSCGHYFTKRDEAEADFVKRSQLNEMEAAN